MPESFVSTRVDLQIEREGEERKRAESRGRAAQARLRQGGQLSKTPAGAALFSQHAEAVAEAVERLLEKLIRNPYLSGPHHAAWPLLLEVGTRGPRSLAAIALGVVVDRVAAGPIKAWRLHRAIGSAFQDELRASRLERRDPGLCRLVQQRLGTRAAGRAEVLRRLQLNPEGWSLADRADVGALMLSVIASSTGLVQERGRLVVPAALDLSALAAAAPAPIRRLPMLVPPRDWKGMRGGGHLTTTEPLVRCRKGLDLGYLEGELAPVLRAVNYLQRQPVSANAEMVALQRRAWDAGVAGLFPVLREPFEAPPRPADAVGREAMGRWRAAVERARRDRSTGRAARTRIEEALRQCEAVAGEEMWQAYCIDHRGRVYTSSRFATHQGPDHEKACIEFAAGAHCSSDGFDWLLQSAAGHWGVRDTWQARLQWGRQNLDRMIAAAENPFGSLDHWRPAKDPWQFLQVARAVRDQALEPGARCACPIRLDQTCSGAAIAAALVRDPELAGLTNLVGGGLSDLYLTVAADLVGLVRRELVCAPGGQRRMAEWWLDRGITRQLAKKPVVAALMGGTWLGLVDILTAELADEVAAIEQWRADVVAPARFLAQRFRAVLETRLAPVRAVEAWLRATASTLLPRGAHLAWRGPSGFPMRLGEPHDGLSPVTTLTGGRHRWRARNEPRSPGGELSARATAPSLMPNVIHSFDASFLHLVLATCEEHDVPVLTNHDCFAARPEDAAFLHGTLHRRLHDIYQPDWLARMADDFAAQAPGLRVPPPPVRGRLDPQAIGSNPHHFS